MQNVVIVGAGAMGCLFGARLAEAGVAVTLVDVDATRLAALDSEGITLSDDGGERSVAVCAALAGDVQGPADLVMLFTKGMHSAAAVRSVAHLADGHAYALTLQNGIGNAEIMAETFAPGRVLMGITDFPADLEGPTKVESHGAGHTRLGGFTPEAQTAAQAVAVFLNRGRLNAEAVADVSIAVWEKVAFNAALNALQTVTGLTSGGLDAAAGHRIIAAVVREVAETAAAKGIRLDPSLIDQRIAFALDNHRNHKTSMLQDRLAGRPTEIESINGAIVRAAEAYGVRTPVTSTLADLVRLLEVAQS